MSFIFRGLDLSLLNYADDILNLSRTLALIEKNFASLSEEYNDIGLKFNPSKSECIKFNSKRPGSDSTTVTLGDSDIELSSSLTYLGLPLGTDLKSTCAGLLGHFSTKARTAYVLLVNAKTRYSKNVLARLYNAYTIPHVLALAPFWKLFTMTDLRTIRKLYYKYAKYLLSLPLWARNRKVTQLYGVTDPFVAVDQRRAEFVSSLDRSHPYYSAFI